MTVVSKPEWVEVSPGQGNLSTDARGLRPRSASPMLLTELPSIRPYTVPLAEPFITRDLGRRRSRMGRLPPRPSVAPTPLHPPETLVMRDVGRGIRPTGGAGPRFLDKLHRLRRRRLSAASDGWIHSRQDAEPALVSLFLFFFLPHTYASSSLPYLPMITRTLARLCWRRVRGTPPGI